jgi:hypothetical protein
VDVLEGDGALINIKSRVNPVPVVQVLDANNKPLQGAVVVFFLPSQGAGGAFGNGTRNLQASTDREGKAAAPGIVPNNQTGQFEIRASASYQGQTASAVITQTNVSGVSASNTGGGFSKKGFIILAAVAGAVVGGIFAARAATGGGSTPGQGIVITSGTPTVVGPK